MDADKRSRNIIFYPTDEKYSEKIRQFQGCPTIAVTKNGRIFAGWYSGGVCEPHIENYNLLVMSDNGGKTWSKPLLVIPSDGEALVQALDIQLYIDKSGALHICWVQNNVVKITKENENENLGYKNGYDGFFYGDFEHAEWEIACKNPDAQVLEFTEPRFLYHGFLRCKPTFLSNGDELHLAYNQLNDRYAYFISHDNGFTFEARQGAKKLNTPFDEGMAYELSNGDVRFLARTGVGKKAESFSHDFGKTFDEAIKSDIPCANTRHFIAKLPSGRVLLVNNDDEKTRTNMALWLSEDDGKTWKYKQIIDTREPISYPDCDFANGIIYLVYDCGRTTDKEIMLAKFTEDDIINGNKITPSIISKP